MRRSSVHADALVGDGDHEAPLGAHAGRRRPGCRAARTRSRSRAARRAGGSRRRPRCRRPPTSPSNPSTSTRAKSVISAVGGAHDVEDRDRLAPLAGLLGTRHDEQALGVAPHAGGEVVELEERHRANRSPRPAPPCRRAARSGGRAGSGSGGPGSRRGRRCPSAAAPTAPRRRAAVTCWIVVERLGELTDLVLRRDVDRRELLDVAAASARHPASVSTRRGQSHLGDVAARRR